MHGERFSLPGAKCIDCRGILLELGWQWRCVWFIITVFKLMVSVKTHMTGAGALLLVLVPAGVAAAPCLLLSPASEKVQWRPGEMLGTRLGCSHMNEWAPDSRH